MVYCYISGCSVKLQALTNAIFCPGCTGMNSGLEVGEGRVEEESKHAHMARGYISLWEKVFPSTNPSSSTLGLRWEITVCWCLVAMDLLDFGHLEYSDLSSWTAPGFGASFQCFFSPTSTPGQSESHRQRPVTWTCLSKRCSHSRVILVKLLSILCSLWTKLS